MDTNEVRKRTLEHGSELVARALADVLDRLNAARGNLGDALPTTAIIERMNQMADVMATSAGRLRLQADMLDALYTMRKLET